MSEMNERQESLRHRFSAFVEKNETRNWSLETILLTLAGIIAIRNLLEIAVAGNPIFKSLAAFVHYPLAYLGPFVALTLTLSFWSRVSPLRVSRLMVQAWLLTLLPPLVDWFLHSGRAKPTIAYLHVDPVEVPWVIANFFNPLASFTGTTEGIRLEALAAVIAGAFYVYLRSGRWWRTLGAAISIYVVSLFFFCLPALVLGLFRFLHPAFDWPDLLRGEAFLIRPAPETSGDSMGVLWLVPLLLLLVLVWRWWERRFPERTFVDSPDSLLPGSPLYLAGSLLTGTWYALRLHFPPDVFVSSVPFDLLASFGAALAVALLGSGALRCRGAGRAWLWFLPGLALAAALGRSVSLGLLACAGALLPVGLGLFEGRLRRTLTVVALPLAALAAFCAGFALVYGPEALARLQAPIVLCAMAGALALALFAWPELARNRWWLPLGLAAFCALGAWPAAGTLVALVALVAGGVAGAIGVLARGNEAGASEAWLCLLASLVLFIVGAVHLGDDGRREELAEATRCVARLRFLQGDEEERAGHPDAAINFYRSSLSCDSDYVPALEALGNAFLEHKNLSKQALLFLSKAVALSPEDPGLRNNLAAAYLHAEEPEKALEELDIALSFDGRQVTVLENRARVLDQLGRSREALEAWESYVEQAWGRPSQAYKITRAAKRIRQLKQGKP